MIFISSVQFISVAQSCPTLCNPMNCSTSGLCPSPSPGVHPTLVHWVGDVIQPSHPLSFPSLPAFNLCQHQGLFKSQFFASALVSTNPDAGKDWRQEEKWTREDEMVGWHHWLDGHEFEQVLGIGDGQGSLACCSPWGYKELDMTERLNRT